MAMTKYEREVFVRKLFDPASILYREHHDEYTNSDILYVDTEVLLSLPQMVRWCEVFGVPFENLSVDAENGSTGCETCGYGSSVNLMYRMVYPEGSII